MFTAKSSLLFSIICVLLLLVTQSKYLPQSKVLNEYSSRPIFSERLFLSHTLYTYLYYILHYIILYYLFLLFIYIHLLYVSCFKERGKKFLLFLILTLVVQGPLSNTVKNFERAADSVLCGEELAMNQTQQLMQRASTPLLRKSPHCSCSHTRLRAQRVLFVFLYHTQLSFVEWIFVLTIYLNPPKRHR